MTFLIEIHEHQAAGMIVEEARVFSVVCVGGMEYDVLAELPRSSWPKDATKDMKAHLIGASLKGSL